MKTSWKWLLGFVALAAGCEKKAAAIVAPATPLPVAVTTGLVESRALSREIRVVGTFRGCEEAVLTSKVEGRVKTVAHEVGDRVKPGEVLAELDDVDLRLAEEEAAAGLALELSKIGLSAVPEGDPDLSQLPSVKRARELEEMAASKLARLEKLGDPAAVSKDERDRMATEVRVAKANREQALLDAHATLAAARHKQAALSVARQRRSETKIVVPVPSRQDAGIEYVVAERMISAGEMARPMAGSPMFRLVIDRPLKLVVRVPERNVSQVNGSLEVEVQVDAWPGEVFAGKVTRISTVVDEASRTFAADIEIPNADGRLRAGGFGHATLRVSKDAPALTVPPAAVSTYAGVTKVFVMRDGKATGIPVKTGLLGKDWIEVTGALAAGDTVITSGQSGLADGTAVRLREAVPPAEKPK